MKGQMFLIATLIIVSSLFLARFSVRGPGIARQKMLLEMNYEKEFFDNLQQEMKNSLIFSADQKENITLNAYDFLNFSRKKSYERGFKLKIFFVGIYSNHTNSSLKISSINLLDEKINESLNLNGSIKEKELNAYEQWDTIFSITPGSTYLLQINFDTKAQNLTLKTSEDSDVYFYFFDLNLSSDKAIHIKKLSGRIELQ